MDSDTWKYLPVLNAGIKVLVTIGLGAVFGYFRIFDTSFVPHAVRFVFYVALPCLIIRGLGTNIDFYSDANIWAFICAFLILRAIALLFAFMSVLFSRKKSDVGIGDVAVRWLTLTWISTVILGVPIMTAVFGNPQKGRDYGILAGISSFIFQLPLQLCFLECHTIEQEQLKTMSGHSTIEGEDIEAEIEGAVPVSSSAKEESEIESGAPVNSSAREADEGELVEVEVEEKVTSDESEVEVSTPGGRWSSWASLLRRRDIWKKIGIKILKNPVLWAIFIGFVLSLSTVGLKYLRPPPPPNETFVPGLKWINDTLAWFGACVSPLSLFAMGVWMQDQGRRLVSIGPVKLSLCMLSKLVVVPLIMVGLAKGLNLNNEAGRAAVLIATLPISLASFTLGRRYKIGEGVLAANVFVGTALMLPTVLIWNLIMDAVNLFPV